MASSVAICRHGALPTFIASLSIFPALNDGDFDAAIEIVSPVRGLRPVRADRALAVKVPNPGSRTSSPSARASPIMPNTLSTASPPSSPCQAVPSRQTLDHFRLVHPVSSPKRRATFPGPGERIARDP